MNTSSSKALINQNKKIRFWRIFSLSIQGETILGSKLFKINCVGCHGISAQGFVGPDLHEATQELSDKKIINQVIRGLTPPMPSFEIEPKSMADLLAYMHSLN